MRGHLGEMLRRSSTAASPACRQTSPAVGDGSVAGILEENDGGLAFRTTRKRPRWRAPGARDARVCVGPGSYGQGAPDTFAQLMMPPCNEVGVASGQTSDPGGHAGMPRSSARCPLTSGAANEVPTQ
jgi:hypothetical protein